MSCATAAGASAGPELDYGEDDKGGVQMELAEAGDDAGDEALPKHGDVGRILVRVGPSTGGYAWDYDVLDHDGSTFWISEGVGFDWWLDDLCEFSSPGTYVVEGIIGQYHRGDWTWGEDDDETWEHAGIRAATADELAAEALS